MKQVSVHLGKLITCMKNVQHTRKKNCCLSVAQFAVIDPITGKTLANAKPCTKRQTAVKNPPKLKCV